MECDTDDMAFDFTTSTGIQTSKYYQQLRCPCDGHGPGSEVNAMKTSNPGNRKKKDLKHDLNLCFTKISNISLISEGTLSFVYSVWSPFIYKTVNLILIRFERRIVP